MNNFYLKLIILLTTIFLSNNTKAQVRLPIKDTITMSSFMDLKDKYVYNITVTDGLYKAVYNYNGNTHISWMPLENNKFASITSWSLKPTVSVITIPFKVRPHRENLPQNANTSIKSVGLLIGPYRKTERYFASGKVSTHKWSANLVIAPAAEEFNPENSNQKLAKSNQLVLSTGVGITYTYNAISFAIIPFAKDFGLSAQSKDWVYNKKFWYGFGIGVDTKLLGF